MCKSNDTQQAAIDVAIIGICTITDHLTAIVNNYLVFFNTLEKLLKITKHFKPICILLISNQIISYAGRCSRETILTSTENKKNICREKPHY